MATDSLGTLTVDLIANTGGFERGIERAERTIKGQQKALSNLRAEFDPTLAAYDRLEKRQEQLNRIFKSGSGVIDKAEYENLSKAINEARSALDAGGSSLNKYGQTAKQAAWAMRGLPAQFTDIAVSLQAGQNPLTVFLQQGGQIKDQFGGVGAALKGTAGYIGSLITPATLAGAAIAGLGIAYYDAYKTQQEFNQALYQGNGTIGVSAEQLQNLAKQAGLATGNLSGAEDAFKALAAAGNLSNTQLQNLGEAAAAVSEYTGKGADDIAKSFAAMGESATQAAQKVSQQYGLITAEQYEVIKAIDDQGDHQRALDQLSEDLNKNALERLKTYKGSLSELERDWDNVKDAIGRAYSAVKAELFPDNAKQIEIIQRQIDYINKHPVLSAFTYAGGGSRDEVLADLEARKKALQDAGKQTDLNAQIQAELTKASQDYISVSSQLNQQLSDISPETKKAKAIELLNDRFQKLMQAEGKTGQSSPLLFGVDYNGQNFSGGAYDQLLKQINDQYSKKSPKGQASIYREDAGTKMLDNLRQQYASMQLQLDTGEKLGTQAQALAKWEEELAQIKSKKTLTADQQQLLASSDLITAQLKRNAGLEQELKLRQENLKVLAYQDSLNSKLQSQQQGYDLDLAGLGAGSKERQRIQEQLRLEQSRQNDMAQLAKLATLGEGNGGISQSQYKKQLDALDDFYAQSKEKQKKHYEDLDAAQQDWGKGVQESLQNYVDNASNSYQQAADAANTILSGSVKGISDGIYDVLTGAESLNDALGNIAATIGQSIIQALAQMAAQWLVLQAVQLAVGQTGTASAIAEAAIAGPAIASAYAPAAAMASLASFGANAPAAIAGISATNIAAQSYALLGMAHDGIDAVPETGTWLLQKGERVTTASTSAKLDKTLDEVQAGTTGYSNIQVINNGEPMRARQEIDGKTMKIILDRVEDDFAGKMASGTGKYPKAVEAPYSLKRRGG